MSYKSFCKEFAKNNKLSSDDARRLSESVQKLLKKNDQPTTTEIKNQIDSILPNKIAKRFAKDLFEEISLNTNYSYEDYDYEEEYSSKSKKRDKNRKRKESPKQRDRKKSKYDYQYDDEDDDYDDYYDNSDLYYSYYESSSEDIYSYSDIPEKDEKRKFGYDRNIKNKIRGEKNGRPSTDHLTPSKTMFSRAYASSEYQKLSKNIQQKKVPLTHRVFEKNVKNDKKFKPNNSNQNDIKDDSSNNEKGANPNEKDVQPKANVTETVRQRFIIYVAGLSAQVNTISKLYRQFHTYGRILGIQVNRQELYALIEFNDLKSAYTAVNTKKPIFGNKLIKLGFASNVDSEMLEMFRKKEEEIEKQSKEMKSDLIFIDEDKQSDFSYDQSDDESYDMPDV